MPHKTCQKLLPLMIGVTLFVQCRGPKKEENALTRPHTNIEPMRIEVIGDTREQLWTCQHSDTNHSLTKSSLRITRLKHQGGSELISFPETMGYYQTRHQEGKTTITLITGYLPNERVVFQRMRSDLPGELDVEVRLTPRSGNFSSPSAHTTLRELRHQNAPASQCWLLPFESEVTASNDGLQIQGEGELLILWHLPASPDKLVDDWHQLFPRLIANDSPHVDINQLADRLETAAQQSMK